MRTQIVSLSRAEMAVLISAEISSTLSEKEQNDFRLALEATTVMWAGLYRGELRAIWGLAPPTLMSDAAYLWMHVVRPLDDALFAFVRHSQMAIEEALHWYPTIVGHCLRDNASAIRWLKWLGATFDRPTGRRVQFTIRARAKEIENDTGLAS